MDVSSEMSTTMDIMEDTSMEQSENVLEILSVIGENDAVEPEPQNGCETPRDESEKPLKSPEETIEAEPAQETSELGNDGGATTPSVISRELKSILELSKEANLDTNLTTHRRKTLDKSANKSSRVNNSFPVTAESELESSCEPMKMGDGMTPPPPKKSKKKQHDTSLVEGASIDYNADFVMPRKPDKDAFCWRCHSDCVQVACETCPRSYHFKCIKQIVETDKWHCPECATILRAENTLTRSKALKEMSLDQLCNLLKFAVKRMIRCPGSEPFIHGVDEKEIAEYKKYIICPMYLTKLESNIKENVYGSTQAFEADAKWIIHNNTILNTYFPEQAKNVGAAKSIVKICKQEMAEIENCPSCYLNANTKKNTWFVEVCPKPHLLVWAKLKGFPYWPAKVMSISTAGMVDVRFFGAHDKAWISIKDCYMYSVKDPNSGKQKRNDIAECVKELDMYVENLRRIYGKVVLAQFKTPLNQDYSMRKQLLEFLPNYEKVASGEMVIRKTREFPKIALRSSSSGKGTDNSTSSSDDNDEDNEKLSKLAKNKEKSVNGDKGKDNLISKFNYHIIESKEKPKQIILLRKILPKEVPNLEFTKVSSKINEETHKIKIADQLIKKLENADDTKKSSEEPQKETKSQAIVINDIDTSDKNQSPVKAAESEKKTEEGPAKTNADPIGDVTVESTAAKQLPKASPDSETKGKKRKIESADVEKASAESTVFPPNKMVKLVPIENILEKKNDPELDTPTPAQQLVVLKEVRVVKHGVEEPKKTAATSEPEEKSDKTATIKKEVESDEEGSKEVEYMEAKRQYLSALNISEKSSAPVKPKQHEIRTRSKTEEKKKPSATSDKTKSSDANSKEICVKSLSKMQAAKHKARKTFPTPNYANNKNKPAFTTTVTRRIVPKTTATDDDVRIVNASTLQTSSGNVVILPKLHYNKPPAPPQPPQRARVSSPPLLTMLPRALKLSETAKNLFQSEDNAVTLNSNGGSAGGSSSALLVNNILANPALAAPPIADIDQNVDAELTVLKEILPDGVAKRLNEIVCAPPPKLKPKPASLMASNASVLDATTTAVPSSSTAGPISARINNDAQKMGEYFSNLLVGIINDYGQDKNAEAAITGLKHEIEELKHKHSVELAEIKRNVSVVLKDIQKSFVEERERIIDEIKVNCEAETAKKVDEAKSKQWCANCLKEAQFYCCWNTSYCDYPCQQKHWPKHMSKCTQSSVNQQQPATSTPIRSTTGQQIILTPTAPPKFGTLLAKPAQKVYFKRAPPATSKQQQQSPGHITLVESGPGNFELLGSIAYNGKILASTSVIEKIKSSNVVTVTASSGGAQTHLSSANAKTTPSVVTSESDN